VTTGSLTTIGHVAVASSAGDMTTNGDGTLYYLMDQATPTLYEIAPTSSAIGKMYTVSADGNGSQALAFWGGSFYAFENSVINRFDPKTGTTTALGTAPLDVTGAGQSTCVPKPLPPAR
jgi:hypothetical protein